jgi:hypothetical protein
VIDEPGAKSDMKEATLEKDETASLSVVEPTLMALEMQAGEEMALVQLQLPAAITVAVPAERRLLMASASSGLSLSQAP